eukprot:COSAG05_NODE_5460_length_1168_cov_1.087933_2_plen_134_part_00
MVCGVWCAVSVAAGTGALSAVMLERLLNRVLEIGERMAAKLPNGTYAAQEKVRYANTRLALEFATNMLSAGYARSVLLRLLVRGLACLPLSFLSCLSLLSLLSLSCTPDHLLTKLVVLLRCARVVSFTLREGS